MPEPQERNLRQDHHCEEGEQPDRGAGDRGSLRVQACERDDAVAQSQDGDAQEGDDRDAEPQGRGVAEREAITQHAHDTERQEDREQQDGDDAEQDREASGDDDDRDLLAHGDGSGKADRDHREGE